ncbi:protein of unknown function [Methylococcus capsulatus]|uniref:Uncharacterized protein n=1 Tax=Methylococcus capsulatus TaxID=414 RepID=A0AA35UGH2_METCP|nr:protein of unknown function [Methylococcus capsulatus]
MRCRIGVSLDAKKSVRASRRAFRKSPRRLCPGAAPPLAQVSIRVKHYLCHTQVFALNVLIKLNEEIMGRGMARCFRMIRAPLRNTVPRNEAEEGRCGLGVRSAFRLVRRFE